MAFITGLLPGGRLARSAAAAAGQVIINYLDALENCEEYLPGAALRDFAVGIGLELIGEKAGELVAEHGIRAVRTGFKRLGFDEAFEDVLRKLDDVDVSPPCKNSFSAETEVVTEEGNQPISTLEEGDVVLAYNEETGEIDYYPVSATISHEDPVVEYLTIDGETVVTTPNHPFYTDEGEWVNAGELQAGDRIRRADGSTGTVEAVAFVYAPQPMYNLTVATAHTYFAGDGQWLVHNSNCGLKYRGRIFEALHGRGANGKPSEAAAEASLRARDLADELRGIVPPWANRQVTVGVAVRDGQHYLTAFKPGNEQVWNQIKSFLKAKPGYRWVPNNAAPGSDLAHAERILFNNSHATIGVSNTKGLCDVCDPFFAPITEVEIAWPRPK